MAAPPPPCPPSYTTSAPRIHVNLVNNAKAEKKHVVSEPQLSGALDVRDVRTAQSQQTNTQSIHNK